MLEFFKELSFGTTFRDGFFELDEFSVHFGYIPILEHLAHVKVVGGDDSVIREALARPGTLLRLIQ